MERTRRLKVGELAKATGISVRTLHWYDEVGLLKPSQHSSSGHRLYDERDLARLQQILSLRALGFGLDEVRSLLAREGTSLRETVELHLARARAQLDLQKKLCDRLDAVAARLAAAEQPTVEELLQTIEVMTMFERYYTKEQLDALAKRREALGEDAMKQAQEDWAALFVDVKSAIDRGVDPASDEAQALAGRWCALIEAFTGGDPGIEASLNRMYREEPSMKQNGDPAASAFIERARAARSGG